MKLTKRQERLNATLGEMVMARFHQSEQANLPYHRRCLRSRELMKGQIDKTPDPNESGIDVKMNITAPIVRSIHAQVEEIIDPIKEHPFVLKNGDIVSLPPQTQDELDDAIQENMQVILAATGGIPDDVEKLVSDMRQVALHFYKEQAEKAAENLRPEVNQKLRQAKFSQEFTDWVYNYVVYPTAIIKGPVLVAEKIKSWEGLSLVYKEAMIRRVYNLSPFNIYPSPNAKDLQSCEYVIERQRFTSSELMTMANTSGFDSKAILSVLKADSKYIVPYAVIGEGREPDTQMAAYSDLTNTGQYDVFVHYGRIRGEHLISFGIDVESEYMMYESEVWVTANNTVIKAVLNNDPLGRRPFFHASFYNIPGEFWGGSVPEAIEDVQIQCTTAGRALVRNMELSSGPLGEVDISRVLGKQDPTELYPGKMIPVKKDTTNSNNRVYNFFAVPSLSQELWSIYSNAYAAAFDLIGIARLAFGDAQGVSTIGRTSGGVSMMLNQSVKPIKQPLLYAERHVIEPLIQRFVDLELMFNPDQSIKGDVNVEAVGVRGMQEQEQQQNAMQWALQSLAPYANGFSIPPEYIMRLVVSLFKQMSVPTEGLPDFSLSDAMMRDQSMQQQLMAVLGGANGGAGQAPQQQPGGVDATANLDGRSAGAIDTINNMNNM